MVGGKNPLAWFYSPFPSMFTHHALLSCSDSLPGNVSVGHRVAHPVCAWRQSTEEREGNPTCPPAATHPPKEPGSASIASIVRPFTASLRVAWLGDTKRVSRVVAHLAGCQQTGRGGLEGGRGGKGGGDTVGKWSSLKQEMLFHAPS